MTKRSTWEPGSTACGRPSWTTTSPGSRRSASSRAAAAASWSRPTVGKSGSARSRASTVPPPGVRTLGPADQTSRLTWAGPYPGQVRSAPSAMLSEPVSETDHARGPVDAPVTIVEYGDFECPYCAAARPVLAALVADGGVRLVFRNFPLADVHPYALTAALAAEAAAAHGRFWEMHDLLFTHQQRLRDADLAGYARRLGIPVAAAVGDGAQPYGDKVEADFRSGVDSGVRGTPALFVAGRRHDGPVDLRTLRGEVRRAAAGSRSPGPDVGGGRSPGPDVGGGRSPGPDAGGGRSPGPDAA